VICRRTGSVPVFWSVLATFHINGSQGLKQGDVVSHVAYGRGVILDPWGNGEICEVRFEDGVRSVNRCRLLLVEAAPELHSFTAKFPKLSDEDYRALKESIRVYGQFEPVVVDVSGRVLDGRHRLQACRELGIEPRTICIEELKAKSPNALSEVRFIRDSNIERRHLTPSQKAALVLEFLPLARKEADARRRKAQAKGRATRWGQQSNGAVSSEPREWTRGPTTNAILAKRAGVGAVTMSQVVAVADKCPELVSEITNGHLSAAEAAKRIRKNGNTPKVEVNGDVPSLEKKTILHQWKKTWEAFLGSYPAKCRKEVQRIVIEHLSAL
jgi:hypothetical protein